MNESTRLQDEWEKLKKFEKESADRMAHERETFEHDIMKRAEEMIEEYKNVAATASAKAAADVRASQAREFSSFQSSEQAKLHALSPPFVSSHISLTITLSEPRWNVVFVPNWSTRIAQIVRAF